MQQHPAIAGATPPPHVGSRRPPPAEEQRPLALSAPLRHAWRRRRSDPKAAFVAGPIVTAASTVASATAVLAFLRWGNLRARFEDSVPARGRAMRGAARAAQQTRTVALLATGTDVASTEASAIQVPNPRGPAEGLFGANFGPSPVAFSPGGSSDFVAELLRPAALAGLAAMVLFCPLAFGLRGLLASSTLEIIKDDMTQFTQNAFAVVSLPFALLLGETFAVMLQRQQRMCEAVYAEVAEAQALVEQLEFLCGARSAPADSAPLQAASPERMQPLLQDVQAYLSQDLRRLGEPRLLPIVHSASAQRQSAKFGDTARAIDAGDAAAPGQQAEVILSVDPLERLLFGTSIGLPSSICASVMAVRQARAGRLAAAQRQYPAGHFLILGTFAIAVLAVFVLLSAGTAEFEPPEVNAASPGRILTMQAPLFGFLVCAVALAILILKELSEPGTASRRFFGVQEASQETVRGLVQQLATRTASMAGAVAARAEGKPPGAV
mmetsp:Transcript_65437/g.182092  ORF Transcript_65437/g.182092 Transcript_65437/m.182092 type:complete len:495 (+) Transcript_65437:70-1554(+)